ncbi:MAG: CRISPR-associated endonuclease Cas2 [Caldilineaceae bacterium]
MANQTPAGQEKVPPALRNRRQWVVVSYDIPDDKRRTKIMQTLAGYGQRVQYSVFECELRPADLEQLKQRLRALLVAAEDDIRFYALCDACVKKITALGKAEIHRYGSFEIVKKTVKGEE